MKRLKAVLSKIKSHQSKVKSVFFVLSTGRCGTKYLARLLDLAPNATVMHEPPPGCEQINPLAYDLYLKDKNEFLNLKVSDFELLKKHVNIYKNVASDVFGDCYNSIYPFAIPLYQFFNEKKIEIRFIHLVRHPYKCCSSILRVEGPAGPRGRTHPNFGLRASLLSDSETPEVKSSHIWIGINDLIEYELKFIESKAPGSTCLVRIEDMNRYDNIHNLFKWLNLSIPDRNVIEKLIADRSDDVRHSHQTRLDKEGIPPITEESMSVIKKITRDHLHKYGYEYL